MSESFYTTTPRQARLYVEKALRSNLVPFLHSSPGIGKSAIIKLIANDFGMKLIDHRASTSDPTDFSGLPDRVGSKATFKPFDIFPTEDDPLPTDEQGRPLNGWILFMDEFNSAPRSVQAAAYKLILDRMIGQHKLHPRVLIVAAGNLSTDRAITNDLSTALQSRLVHIEMEVNYKEWLEDVALPNHYDPRIIAFLSSNEGYLCDFKPDHKEKTFSCPRTWEFMNSMMSNTTRQEMKQFTGLYAGTITSGVATAFVEFCAVFDKLPRYEDIMKDPAHCPIPMDGPTSFATISTLINRIDEHTFEKLSIYMNRISAEFRVLFYRSVMVLKPELRTHKAFQNAAVELARYLNS